jgi:hypothetical protein
MSESHQTVDSAMSEIERVRRLLRKKSGAQVRSSNECSIIKAVCLTWFKNHRDCLVATVGNDSLCDIDALYRSILTACDHATSRARYEQDFKALRSHFSSLRGLTVGPKMTSATPTVDTPPAFSHLVADPKMQAVLVRRWEECVKCVTNDAPLAATVMMGGLLEALLLARVLRESNKAAIFSAATAPKDKGGKSLQLQEWTLRNYIDVSHELGWISASAKDIGEVLRDYRNYIHPQKELTHGIVLQDGDAKLFWEIAKSITRQLLK